MRVAKTCGFPYAVILARSTGMYSDPRWIPHIDSYCDRRCERCRFEPRCFVHAETQRLGAGGDEESDEAGDPHSAPQNAVTLDELIDASPSEDLRNYETRLRRLDADPLVRRSRDYAFDVFQVAEMMGTNCSRAEAAPAATDAVRTVIALSLSIASKTFRALSSRFLDDDPPDDPVQNDSNGSAKVALVIIDECSRAWRIIANEGLLDAGLTRHLAGELEHIGQQLQERFPHAMAFIRPGFDEDIPGLVRPWSIEPAEEEEDEERSAN